MTTSIQLKRDSSVNWETSNRVLLDGEEGIEETLSGGRLSKIGNGVSGWNSLPYLPGEAGMPSLAAIPAGFPAMTLTFEDLFPGGGAGPGGLDATKWGAITYTNQNGVTDIASNISVTPNQLALQVSDSTHGAQIETGPLGPAASAYASPSAGDAGFMLPANGFAEARLFIPGSDSTHPYNWPAFWTVTDDGQDAGYFEADIYEGLGRNTYGYLYGNPDGNSGPYNYSAGLCNAWHIFGLWRSPGSLSFFLDGALTATIALTRDVGRAAALRLEVGYISSGGVLQAGAAGALLASYVRGWVPTSEAPPAGVSNKYVTYGHQANTIPISPTWAETYDLTPTNAITLANPASYSSTPQAQIASGMTLNFVIRQGSTGYAVTLGTAYKAVDAFPATASTVSSMSFRYDGSFWRQVGRIVTTAA